MTRGGSPPSLQDMTHAALSPARAEAPSSSRVVLDVEFEDRRGRRYSAVGGGSTLEEALAFARESAPDGHHWRVVRFTDLYGE